jgi:hypothetical protein
VDSETRIAPQPRARTAGPLVGKSTSFPFQISVACWIDLLGYGRMISEAEFNPLHVKSKEALGRLRCFHQVVARHSTRHFPTLVMNDGAVAYRDLSLRSRSVTHDFLVRAWSLFTDLKTSEATLGFPGARMVLACGFRMRGRRAGMDASDQHFRSIIGRVQNGDIDGEQAIREAASMRPTFDIVPQLQANFAFTKAYVAESSGSKGGLPGANFYVDLTIFERLDPDWIVLGPEIIWSDKRLALSASFAAVLDLPASKHSADGPTDVLDGLKIAERLAGNPNVLRALQEARKS